MRGGAGKQDNTEQDQGGAGGGANSSGVRIQSSIAAQSREQKNKYILIHDVLMYCCVILFVVPTI